MATHSHVDRLLDTIIRGTKQDTFSPFDFLLYFCSKEIHRALNIHNEPLLQIPLVQVTSITEAAFHCLCFLLRYKNEKFFKIVIFCHQNDACSVDLGVPEAEVILLS